jgi:hypothetical protein
MDLQAGQLFWNYLFQYIGRVASLYHFMKRIREELRSTEVIVEEFYDPNEYLSLWTLEGVALGQLDGSLSGEELRYNNTDKDGLLYVKIVANGYNWDVEVYNNANRQQVAASEKLVCKATNVVAGATGTLSEQNNSGMSGSVKLDAGVGADSTIWIRPKVALLAQINTLPIVDDNDAKFVENMQSVLTNMANRLGSAVSDVESFARTYLIPYVGQKIKSGENTLDASEVSTESVITTTLNGIISDLADAMADETVPGAQSFVQSGSVAGAVVWDGDNIGKGKAWPAFVPVPDPWAIPGVVTFRCVAETIGSEQFQAKLMADDGSKITAGKRLTIDKAWHSLDIGLPLNALTHDPVDSGAEADHFSNWLLYGITADYSDEGKLYCVISGSGTTVDFYSDSARTVQVASGTIAAGTLTIVEFGSSGISGQATVTGTPADGNGLDVDLKPFKLEDKFYVTLPNDPDAYLGGFFGLFKANIGVIIAPGTIDKEVANRGYSGLKTQL